MLQALTDILNELDEAKQLLPLTRAEIFVGVFRHRMYFLPASTYLPVRGRWMLPRDTVMVSSIKSSAMIALVSSAPSLLSHYHSSGWVLHLHSLVVSRLPRLQHFLARSCLCSSAGKAMSQTRSHLVLKSSDQMPSAASSHCRFGITPYPFSTSCGLCCMHSDWPQLGSCNRCGLCDAPLLCEAR